MQFFSHTVPYVLIPLAIVVPPGEQYGEIEKFLRPFSLKVWVVMLTVFVVTVFLIIAVTRLPRRYYDFLIGSNVKTPLYNFLAVVYGISLTVLPARNFNRFVLMNFMLYWLVLRSVYVGKIFTILQSRDHKPEVSSIQEMMDKKFDFYLYETLASRVQNFSFYQRRVVVKNADLDETLLKTLNPSFKGVVLKHLTPVLYLNEVNKKNFTLRVCKERFSFNHFVLYFRKNHFLVDEISEKIDAMLENGLIQHMTSKYIDQNMPKADTATSEGLKVLAIDHFAGLFKLYGFFLLTTVLVFVVEIITKIKKLSMLRQVLNFVQYKLPM